MRKLLFFSIVMLIANQLQAQVKFKRNTLYTELAGNGMVISANWERQLGTKPGLGLHVGIGLGGDKPNIPFGVKYLVDLGNNKSYFESGLGVTLTEEDFVGDNKNVNDESYYPVFIPSVGYRHNTAYGLMWRVNYTPLFSGVKNIYWLCGFSIGWRV